MEAQNTESYSYAGVTKRSFPSLVLDFSSEASNAILTTTIIADFLFEDLKLKKQEVTKVSKVPSPPIGQNFSRRTVRIRTEEEIIVKDRFGDSFEFQRSYGNIQWRCQIRGGRKNSNLRLLNVPDDMDEERMVGAIKSFAKPLSEVKDEVFGQFHDPRLNGIPNGNKLILIEVEGIVPEYIEIGSRKIRVLHRSQPRRCYACNQAGHFQVDCPKKMNETDQMLNAEMDAEALQVGPDEPLKSVNGNFPSLKHMKMVDKVQNSKVDEKYCSKEPDKAETPGNDFFKKNLPETGITSPNDKVQPKRNKTANKSKTSVQTRSKSTSACSSQMDQKSCTQQIQISNHA